MTAQEQLIIDIIEKYKTQKITMETATNVLNVSERTIYRYLKGIATSGITFVQHGNKSRIPKNKTTAEVILKSQTLMKEKYFDFNMTHALEKLAIEDNIKINRETFRKVCHGINLVKKSKRKKSRVRKLRSRTTQAGVMLQMDGSPHRWFNNEETCLIATIDDANNENYYGEFFESETTVGCLQVLRKIIEKKGLFSILYTDRAGIFAGPKRADFSQVKRALSELGIQIIYANSAEAKGRIERHWQTLQDRLVPEMRLRQIKTISAANNFLNEQFLPTDYNKNFKVVPADLSSGWKALPSGISLDDVFCFKYARSVKSDHTFSFEGRTYKIISDLKYSIQNQKVEIRVSLKNETAFYFADRILEVELHHQAPQIDIDDKLEILVDQKDAIKVRKDSHVFYQNKYYSVASQYIGKLVVIKEHDSVLLFYYRTKLIESHNKIKSVHYQNSTKPEHLKPWQDTLLTTSIYRRRAREIGEHCDKFVFTVLQKGQGVVDNKTIWTVIKLKENYTKTLINEACDFAFSTGSLNLRSIMSYLNLRGRKTKIS